MQNFYIQVKKIVDSSIERKTFFKTKKDFSIVTTNDLVIQKKLINLIKKYFPDIKQFICEEGFDIKKFKKFDLKKPFAIIDPIDGTENYYSNSEMFGTLISINSKIGQNIDLIYLPKLKKIITRENILKISKKPNKNNNISLLSTKCLDKSYKGSQYRIYGSSAYSFYKFIIGEVNEYIYCEGAKIWDCFTGLRLSSLIKCKIQIDNKNWKEKTKFKIKFKLRWI